MLIETPHKEMEVTDFSGFTKYRFKNLFVKPSPLPCLSWGNSDDVWIKMLNKELKYVHDKNFLCQHSKLQPKMRAILLDWLLEVCEVYTLHRETFYLAQDFFDRFMLTQENINKNRLQLIGITSLFIACKIEEIYPPKLHELAYITDGACAEEEILDMELIVLKALNWDLCPETVISWLKLYIQMASLKEEPNILLPQFSQDTFIQVAQLLDVCILDINSLDYQYGVLAAAAFFHYTSLEVVQKVSGLNWDSISNCVNWMDPFAKTVTESSPAKLKDFQKISIEDRHNIQTHTNYLDILGSAYFASLAHQHTQRLRCWLRGSTIVRPPQRISMTTVWIELKQALDVSQSQFQSLSSVSVEDVNIAELEEEILNSAVLGTSVTFLGSRGTHVPASLDPSEFRSSGTGGAHVIGWKSELEKGPAVSGKKPWHWRGIHLRIQIISWALWQRGSSAVTMQPRVSMEQQAGWMSRPLETILVLKQLKEAERDLILSPLPNVTLNEHTG
ncbi:UNVERIFIED_CONTAM: hypothetical protein FKN15_078004 [Acipenser sinensis]